MGFGQRLLVFLAAYFVISLVIGEPPDRYRKDLLFKHGRPAYRVPFISAHAPVSQSHFKASFLYAFASIAFVFKAAEKYRSCPDNCADDDKGYAYFLQGVIECGTVDLDIIPCIERKGGTLFRAL